MQMVCNWCSISFHLDCTRLAPIREDDKPLFGSHRHTRARLIITYAVLHTVVYCQAGVSICVQRYYHLALSHHICHYTQESRCTQWAPHVHQKNAHKRVHALANHETIPITCHLSPVQPGEKPTSGPILAQTLCAPHT